jgi:hypothetical protein
MERGVASVIDSERTVIHQHDVHFDGFEEAGGDAGTVELKSSNVF